jgi:hypothetical protein
MATPHTRTIYQPSGRVRPLRLALVLALALAACAVVSAGYFLVLIAGFYVFVAGVIVPVTLLGFVTYLGIWWSHCRNPRLAVALGTALGLIGYLGYFHPIRRCDIACRTIDRLPAFVLFSRRDGRLAAGGKERATAAGCGQRAAGSC